MVETKTINLTRTLLRVCNLAWKFLYTYIMRYSQKSLSHNRAYLLVSQMRSVISANKRKYEYDDDDDDDDDITVQLSPAFTISINYHYYFNLIFKLLSL